MFFIYKIIMGILKRDPRFKPLENTSIRFYERLLQIAPSLSRKFPSKLSRILVYRYYFKKRKSQGLLNFYKIKNWRFRLWVSSTLTYILHRGLTSFRRFHLLNPFFFGLVFGTMISETDLFPGQEFWTSNFLINPRNDYMLSFILEDFSTKHSFEYTRKDNLALGLDRMILKGIENKELDPLSWMVIGSRYASLGESEFSYLAFQMAHYKDHQNIGGNSSMPLEGLEAERFYSRKEEG
jgi:hypothetical protein